METKWVVKAFALAVLLPIVILAFAAAPAEAKSSDNGNCQGQDYTKNCRPDSMVVDTVRIDTTIYLYQVPLTEAQLAMLGEIIPVNLLADNHIQYLKFDGTE